MNRFAKLVCIAFLSAQIFSTIGCVILETKELPPGQEKKIEGDQSAKEHAPGQEKKDKEK
ncbi:MAG: hypothetical protein JSV89_03185 [Spirochaetaceae bacterium]|nr:MAG: hypothetical protein JSV89_03185 [Spirochaetaceae bacterium]